MLLVREDLVTVVHQERGQTKNRDAECGSVRLFMEEIVTGVALVPKSASKNQMRRRKVICQYVYVCKKSQR